MVSPPLVHALPDGRRSNGTVLSLRRWQSHIFLALSACDGQVRVLRELRGEGDGRKGLWAYRRDEFGFVSSKK
jgi:hypothetical protein